jgi:hypothetical protein
MLHILQNPKLRIIYMTVSLFVVISDDVKGIWGWEGRMGSFGEPNRYGYYVPSRIWAR